MAIDSNIVATAIVFACKDKNNKNTTGPSWLVELIPLCGYENNETKIK